MVPQPQVVTASLFLYNKLTFKINHLINVEKWQILKNDNQIGATTKHQDTKKTTDRVVQKGYNIWAIRSNTVACQEYQICHNYDEKCRICYKFYVKNDISRLGYKGKIHTTDERKYFQATHHRQQGKYHEEKMGQGFLGKYFFSLEERIKFCENEDKLVLVK